LNKWDFLMVFQVAQRPIREACKSVIRKAISCPESPDFHDGSQAIAVVRGLSKKQLQAALARSHQYT
jgi:hypothetical protein